MPVRVTGTAPIESSSRIVSRFTYASSLCSDLHELLNLLEFLLAFAQKDPDLQFPAVPLGVGHREARNQQLQRRRKVCVVTHEIAPRRTGDPAHMPALRQILRRDHLRADVVEMNRRFRTFRFDHALPVADDAIRRTTRRKLVMRAKTDLTN